MRRRPPRSTLFPYTTLCRAHDANGDGRIRGAERMNRTISTVAVYNGLVFAPDFSGFFHCLDAETGKHHWTYDMQAARSEAHTSELQYANISYPAFCLK